MYMVGVGIVCIEVLFGNHRVVIVYQTCLYLFSPTVQTT